jgi:hypothetical protein
VRASDNNLSVDTTTERSAHVGTDQISFYDEPLKKQIEASFVSDGKEIHVSALRVSPIPIQARASITMHRFCQCKRY